MRLFLDTTILLDYLLDSRGAFHEPAVKLMTSIAAGDHEGGFATSQATDLYNSLNMACNDGVPDRFCKSSLPSAISTQHRPTHA